MAECFLVFFNKSFVDLFFSGRDGSSGEVSKNFVLGMQLAGNDIGKLFGIFSILGEKFDITKYIYVFGISGKRDPEFTQARYIYIVAGDCRQTNV